MFHLFPTMDFIIPVLLGITVFILCSLCTWCFKCRRNEGIIYSQQPAAAATVQQTVTHVSQSSASPYPRQAAGSISAYPISIQTMPQPQPVNQHGYAPPVGFAQPPYPTAYPRYAPEFVGGTPYPSATSPVPYPITGTAGVPPSNMASVDMHHTPYPVTSPYGPGTVNMPVPTSIPQYPINLPAPGQQPPSYSEATAATAQELYSKQAPYNPNY